MTPESVLVMAFKGNRDAVSLARLVNRVAEVWDDLIDKDKPQTDADINAAFIAALSEIPRNAFYQRHAEQLGAVMNNVIAQWLIANQFERRADVRSLEKSHVLRYLGVSVWVAIADAVGGVEWAAKWGALFWDECTMEPLAQYLDERLKVAA